MTTLNLQVGAGADDVLGRQNNSTLWNVGSSSGRTGNYSATNRGYAGVSRFTGVTIGQGDTIDAATMVLTVRNPQSGTTCDGDIDALDADNAAMPADYAAYVAAARTAARVAWNSIPAWPITNVEKTSPELKTVFQELVNRVGWASGNAMVVSFHDEDETSSTAARRDWYAYDADSAKAAKLDIDYTVGEPAVVEGSAILTGAGAIVASALAVAFGTTSLTGAGALSGAAFAIVSGGGWLTASGGLRAAGMPYLAPGTWGRYLPRIPLWEMSHPSNMPPLGPPSEYVKDPDGTTPWDFP